MLEKELEKKLVQATKNMGGLALKFTSPGFSGMPDRLLLLPGGKIAFVEVKAHGKKPRSQQVKRHKDLKRLGFKVYVLDEPKQIDLILKDLGGEAK